MDSYLNLIPIEILFCIIRHLSIEDIETLCLAYEDLKEVLDEPFWCIKYIFDTGDNNKFYLTWKESVYRIGEVWVCGNNKKGQLGLGDFRRRLSFEKLGIKAKFLSAGDDYTGLIDFNDDLYMFGSNERDKLCLGSSDVESAILKLAQRDRVNYYVYLDSYGTQSVWPHPTGIKAKFVACSKETLTLIIDREDKLRTSQDQNEYASMKFASSGAGHMMMIDKEDNLYAMGCSNLGQLGIGKNFKVNPFQPVGMKVKQVACGFYHTAIIDLEDELWTFGYGVSGQLGLGDPFSRYLPEKVGIKTKYVACGFSFTALIDENDDVIIFGYKGYIILKLKIKAKKLACGNDHIMIIDLENNLWAFGSNNFGQLGLGNTQDAHDPILVGIKARDVSCGGCHTIIRT